MARAFAELSFTPAVKAAQTRYGSRTANTGFELTSAAHQELTAREMAFIAARNSFYQATVNEHGWPYVQHRGGPAGFLQVLDSRHLAYADFSGNRQYLSVGNLSANPRISLFLMDYVQQRRLKIWGTTRIIHAEEHPELLARLENPQYRAPVERGILITVEAWDWNCPKHITPRFSAQELDGQLAALHQQIAVLQAQLKEQERRLQAGVHTFNPVEH